MLYGYKKIITGSKNARKSGSNANNGDPQTPKQTVAALVALSAANNIILAGVYREDLSINGNNWYGDGQVIFEGVNPVSSNFIFTNNISPNYYDFTFRNYAGFYKIGGGAASFCRCRFENIPNFMSGATSDSIVINCTNTGLLSFSAGSYTRCIIKNSTFNAHLSGFYINQSYVGPECVITLNATSLTAFKTFFTQNDWNGLVYYGGVGYVVPKAVDLTGSGTGVVAFASRTGTYPPGAADWIHNLFSITPTVCYVTNANFNSDPLFRDYTNNDFTVPSNSPLVGKIAGALDRLANIGYVAVITNMQDLSTWNINNLTNTLGLFTLSSGDRGALVSPAILVNSNYPRALQELNLSGLLEFDSSQTAGTVDRNNNVPIIKTYKKQGSTITNSSPRPCLKMRLSNNPSVTNYYKTVGVSTGNDTVTCTDTNGLEVGMEVFGDGIEFGATILSIITNVSVTLSANCFKTVASVTMMTATPSEWDNNTYTGLNAGDWFIVELTGQPKIDQNGYGSADNNFDLVNNGLPMGKCMQFCIEIWSGTSNG